MAAGFGLMFWAVADFWRAKTDLLPFKPARTLVIVPPYTFTRNPMYLGLTLAYLGGALATNWAWPLVFLPVVIWITATYIIRREERYLSAEFGAEYDAYRARVRRWL
jgi:protein-S-isoprenylcysteine O-methyltransferase Ste14